MKYQKGQSLIVLQVEDRKFLDRMVIPADHIYEEVLTLRRAFTKAEFSNTPDRDGDRWTYEDRKETTWARHVLNTKLNKIISQCRKLEKQAEAMKLTVSETKGRK